MAQGRSLNELIFKAKWYPFGPLFTLVLCIIVIIGQGSEVVSGGAINWYGMLVSYISVPVFIIIWLGYKFIKKTKVVPLKECDFSRDDL